MLDEILCNYQMEMSHLFSWQHKQVIQPWRMQYICISFLKREQWKNIIIIIIIVIIIITIIIFIGERA